MTKWIRREFNEMSPSILGALKMYGLLGMGLVIVLWLLGPHVFKLMHLETMYLLTSIIGIILSYGHLSFNLEKEQQNRQEIFLQTLPIRKTILVHAKFISFLILGIFAYAWMVITFTFHALFNGWGTAHWEMPPLMISMFFFVAAVTLWLHYVIGQKHWNLVFYLSLVVWLSITVCSGFILHGKGFSMNLMSNLALAASVVIYLLCWGLSILRVRRMGIAVEMLQK